MSGFVLSIGKHNDDGTVVSSAWIICRDAAEALRDQLGPPQHSVMANGDDALAAAQRFTESSGVIEY